MWPSYFPRTPRGRLFLFSTVFFAVVMTSAVIGTIHHAKGETDDFSYFYGAARGMLEGENIYTAGRARYIYPPFLAFVLQPLALMTETAAAVVWVWVNALLITAAAIVASKEGARRWMPEASAKDASIMAGIAAGAALLCFDKIHVIFTQGQTDFVMLLGFACIARWMEGRPILAGAAVGLTANIKYLSLIFVPYFVWKKNYRAALGSVLFFLLFFFLPTVQVGSARMFEYAGIAGGGLIRMTGIPLEVQKLKIPPITWSSSVSVPSTIFRVTRAQGIADAVAIAGVLSIFSAVAVGIYAMARARGVTLFQPGPNARHRAGAATTSLEWALIVAIATAFSPQATVRHMLLSFLVYTAAIPLLLLEREPRPRTLLLLAMLLMSAAMSLPPRGLMSGLALDTWRAIGGAGWCSVILMLAVAWVGSRVVAQTARDVHAQSRDS